MKKEYIAEMVGTCVLVLMGCGVATSVGCATSAGVFATATAFGLAVVAMAYTIGCISGCHINPAITLGLMLSKRISNKEAGMYMLSQLGGAFIGTIILAALTGGTKSGLGANSLQFGIDNYQGLLAEIVFTCVFVFVVLATTDEKKGAGKSAGMIIGLTLILVHLACIRYTGTSVNPARSIAPALFVGGDALKDLWIFLVGPFAGGALAAYLWKFVGGDCNCCKKD